jgi:LmbE family N-acetylglucosaminyl deacetylase
MRVLAIGAHPDDIEIACSGTLAKCVKRGDTVIVCHVSSGNLGHVVFGRHLFNCLYYTEYHT